MGQSLACCVSRQDEKESVRPLQYQHVHVTLEFFDCVETEEDLLTLINGDRGCDDETHRRGSLRSFDVLEIGDARSSHSMDPDPFSLGHSRECGDGVEVAMELMHSGMQRRCRDVSRSVRDMWKRRIAENDRMNERLSELLESGFQELDEWTTQSAVLRMLCAQDNDEKMTVEVLMQAIELRLLGRSLYKEMKCAVHCDAHIIGRDKLSRPTIYLCTGSQVDPLQMLKDQILLCFEAAVNLCDDENGQITLILDMQGFSARLNANPVAIQDIANHLGTIYADRLAKIIIVDFSYVVQCIWMLIKPLCRERTRNKMAFLSRNKAAAFIAQEWDEENTAKICAAFDINRASSKTASERLAHAENASICDVPLRASRQSGDK